MLKRKPPSKTGMNMNHSSNRAQDLNLNFTSGPSQPAPQMLLQLRHQHHKGHISETQGHLKFQLNTSLLGSKRYTGSGGPSPLPSPSPSMSSFMSASNGGHITTIHSSYGTSGPGSISKNKSPVKLNSNHQTALQHSSITSNMQKSLRRCRSASTIRKKLLNAVEQDNSTSTISKFSTACTQSDQNTSSSRTPTRRPNSAAPNATVVANILSVPGLPAAYRATLRPSSTAYTSLVSSGPLQESKTIARKQEQELDKRLSDLEKISFPDDQTAINAWLNTILFTMDDVIQQDKGFASILFRIRHEVERLMVAKINAQRTPAMTVVEQDLTSNHHRNEFSNGCNCNCHEESNNVHKEVLALRKENKILKKNITAMETQLEMLQFSSMYTEREDVTQDNEKEVVDTHEEEEQELDDILLCNPYDDDVFSNRLYEEENESQGGKTSTHVHNIPQLNLSFLLPYNEEEEEDNDDDHYDEDYQAQEYEQE